MTKTDTTNSKIKTEERSAVGFLSITYNRVTGNIIPTATNLTELESLIAAERFILGLTLRLASEIIEDTDESSRHTN